MSENDKAAGRVLLPDSCTPKRYEIHLTPDLVNFTFALKQRTECVISAPTTSITMHSREIGFWAVAFESSGGKTLKAKTISTDIELMTVCFDFGETLEQGTGFLCIEATGQLNNQMAGFYRSGYTDVDGNAKIMASTQFESLDARRAFVCYDEPSAKAIFQITMVVERHLTCFSNMPASVQKSIPGGKLKEIQFQDSPIMSSYLVAFLVGEFDYVESISKNGVVIRVYTPEGKTSTGDFALKCACDCLDVYDEFFGVPYPLPKLDMVGIPEFAMGAMENWGLVTYREVDLLIDPIKASASQRQRVCTVVTHELAHQWFGNLVTMAWWDDIWLNEGFASWTENMAADVLFPDWGVWEQFCVGHAAAALRLDSLRSSHPIQVPIKHAVEVEEVFDAISYCKGSFVIKMAHAILGREAFQKGLMEYMNQYKYGNTETYMLWGAWEKSSGLPIKEIMKSWTEQMGHPLVTVEKCVVGGGVAELTCSQTWFLSDGSDTSGDDKLWTVPIFAVTDNGKVDDVSMMREQSMTFKIPVTDAGTFIKLNADQEVPCRVLYTSEMMANLSAAVLSKKLCPVDRAGLISDSYALVKAGKLDATELIKLLYNFREETDVVVWDAVAGVLSGLAQALLENEGISSSLEKFATKVVNPTAKRIGWSGSADDDDNVKLLRGNLIGLLSKFCYKDADVLAEAKARFAKFQEDDGDVIALPSDMRVPVFKILLKNGGLKEYEDVLAYFSTASDNAEKKHVLNSLGAIPDTKLKLRTLEWTTSGAVKLQDCFYALGSVHYSGAAGSQQAWDFFKANHGKLNEMLGNASASLMQACIGFSCGGFASAAKATEVTEYFQANPVKGAERRIAQIVEGINGNGVFVERLVGSGLKDDAFWAQF